MQALAENKLNASHLELFSQKWTEHGAEYTNKIREKPIAINGQLSEINWSLQIPLENSKLPLKNSAIITGPDSIIENNDDLFSVDARNPVGILNFKISANEKQ